jgi:hypothetical protein
MNQSVTQVAKGHTRLPNAREAGHALGQSIKSVLGDTPPDVAIVFASSIYAYQQLLEAIQDECHPKILVGCSSAGEFAGAASANQSASILAIKAPEMYFNASVGHGLKESPLTAAHECVAGLKGMEKIEFAYRTGLVLTDALAGYVDELIDNINIASGGSYQLFGGGAGDDAKFSKTHVFYGTQALENAVVMLEILSNKPLGIGAAHGWKPVGELMRVTEAEGNRVFSLNAIPVEEAFSEFALATGQVFDRGDPMPFFLNNVVGVYGNENYKLRVPLFLHEDGSITFAAEIEVGATVRLMSASTSSSCDAARFAAQAAKAALGDAQHACSLVFDCAATRLRLGQSFMDELSAVEITLGSPNYVGCNTYGQIVRVQGQFNGFHNCTAVVCAFPE